VCHVAGSGCRAQAPAKSVSPAVSPELLRSIDKLVHATYSVPPWVDVTVTDRTASQDFPGYDKMDVKISYGDQSESWPMLLSKDSKTLIRVTKMDLTRDPQAELMAKIDLKGRPVRGNKDAKVTVVVFDDFECPYCSRLHQTLTGELSSYGDRIKVVYKDYPLKELHPWATRAAIDSECLARQSGDAFWDFADYVHANGRAIQGEQRPLNEQQEELDRIAFNVGKRHSADEAALASCVKQQATAELDASVKEADGLGIESTPAVFINGMRVDGAVPADQLRQVLDKALKSAGVAVPQPAAAAKAN